MSDTDIVYAFALRALNQSPHMLLSCMISCRSSVLPYSFVHIEPKIKTQIALKFVKICNTTVKYYIDSITSIFFFEILMCTYSPRKKNETNKTNTFNGKPLRWIIFIMYFFLTFLVNIKQHLSSQRTHQKSGVNKLASDQNLLRAL